MEIVFLGMNDLGWRIYNWLVERDSTDVRGIATTPDQLELVERYEPTAVIACGFTHKVPTDVLDVPERGCLNLHPGYLPHTRGYYPNAWSIIDDLPAGATLHYMAPSIDTGDIIGRREVETSFDDGGKDVYRKIERAGLDLFKEIWPEFEAGEVDMIEQDEAQSNSYLKRDFEEICELNPDSEVRVKDFLDRLRALTFPPFDNARIEVDGETYYVELNIRKEGDGDEGDEFDIPRDSN